MNTILLRSGRGGGGGGDEVNSPTTVLVSKCTAQSLITHPAWSLPVPHPPPPPPPPSPSPPPPPTPQPGPRLPAGTFCSSAEQTRKKKSINPTLCPSNSDLPHLNHEGDKEKARPSGNPGSVGGRWWSQLAAHVRTAESLTSFRQRLKAHLFRVHLDTAEPPSPSAHYCLLYVLALNVRS